MSTEAANRTLTLRDLRTTDKTLFVRNNTDSIITCSVGDLDFMLQPKGKPDSVSELPKAVANAPGFRKLWLKRQVIVTDDESLEDEITLLVLSEQEMEAKRHAELTEMTEPSSSGRDLVEKKCLISGETVWQTVADANSGVPPLADRFTDQAHLFVPTQVHGPNGVEFTFSKVSVED